jgi:hypothetical protein
MIVFDRLGSTSEREMTSLAGILRQQLFHDFHFSYLCTRAHEGGFRAHTVGGGGAGAERNLIALLGLLPPITKLLRNQEETVRYITCASGA